MAIGGDQEELDDSLAGVKRAMLLSMALIFVVLGSLFRSLQGTGFAGSPNSGFPAIPCSSRNSRV